MPGILVTHLVVLGLLLIDTLYALLCSLVLTSSHVSFSPHRPCPSHPLPQGPF